MSTEPNQADVVEVRILLDLMANFESNDQRARFLLSSNWMRARDAAATPGVSREAVAQAIEQAASDVDLAKYFLPGTTDRFVDALLAAGIFRVQS